SASFIWEGLMDIPFLKVPASDFSNVVNHYECIFVDFVDDFFHFAVFQTVDDASDFFVLLICVSPFNQTVRSVSAKAVENGLYKKVGFLRNDFIRFRAAESFFNQMNDFRSDEISDSGKESALQAENERNDDKDK